MSNMNVFGCSRRTLRTVMLVVIVVLLLFFVSVNIMYMFFTSLDQRIDSLAHDVQKESDGRMAVQISNIEADVNGNINIQLSLKVKELLRFLEGAPNENGEATNNPPPQEVKYLINNADLCEKSKNLKYLVYVHTSPEHTEKRNLLRSTWASTELFKDHLLERVFLMGRNNDFGVQKKVQEESDKYGDIVQGDFHDNYRNLTLKGMMGLKWISTYCKTPKFAIKADDDAFVNIFDLMRFLDHHEGRQKLLACPLWNDNSMPILRDPAKCAKWCVHFNEFPGRRYFPQYCAGLTFVLSNDLVPAMYQASKTTPFFWIDDVYITGLLPSKVKDVEFVRLIQNFTLKELDALNEIKDETKPYTKLFVHAKQPNNFRTLWDLLLKRLRLEDIKMLSTDFIEHNAVLKNKLAVR